MWNITRLLFHETNVLCVTFWGTFDTNENKFIPTHNNINSTQFKFWKQNDMQTAPTTGPIFYCCCSGFISAWFLFAMNEEFRYSMWKSSDKICPFVCRQSVLFVSVEVHLTATTICCCPMNSFHFTFSAPSPSSLHTYIQRYFSHSRSPGCCCWHWFVFIKSKSI